MKRTVLSVLMMLTTLAAIADEGMWLVKGIDAQMYNRMRRMGLKLKPEALYNEQSPALCDAVVAINGGMGSGSMISDEGLMITNHHVAYSAICAITTPEHNYLEDGFWAASRENEIPLEGFTVQFLRGIIDVTDEAAALRDSMIAEKKWNAMGTRRLGKAMQERYAKTTEFTPSFESMWGGKKYYIYLYEIFRDVRLVAAPPARLGAFGGDTDNWGWPQHKADFTICRVYAGKDGKPADYSADNVPLHPDRVLKVAPKSVAEGDFTMVVGYPGTTRRYMSSFAVEEKQQVRNPIVVDARHHRMDIMRKGMERNDTVRMNYSDRYFGLSNYADYAKWENICFVRFDVKGIREAEEKDLKAWIEADSARNAQYGGLFDRMEKGYAARRDAMRVRTDYAERWFGISEAMIMANRLASTVGRLKQRGEYMFDINDPKLAKFVESVKRLEKADPATDRELFVEIGGSFFDNLPQDYIGKAVKTRLDEFSGDARKMLEWTYDNSCCNTSERLREFLSEPRRIKAVMSDPLVSLVTSIPFQPFMRKVILAERAAGASVTADEREYASLLYDFRQSEGRVQYPNANSTMRLSYGKVCPLDPRDGVHYDWRSTTNGYVEKIDETNHDFRSDAKMLDLIASASAPVQVNFLTDNDITGGNSGSPVVNGRGEIVGLAFDGNRESMAGDVWFNPKYSRTVCVDMGYIMWILRNYAPQSLTEEILR